MASPGDKKGQRKGSCVISWPPLIPTTSVPGCRDKRIGEDNCVLDRPCPICDNFSDSQKELLATPSYRIRKEKKAGILVSPKDVIDVTAQWILNQPSKVSLLCSPLCMLHQWLLLFLSLPGL